MNFSTRKTLAVAAALGIIAVAIWNLWGGEASAPASPSGGPSSRAAVSRTDSQAAQVAPAAKLSEAEFEVLARDVSRALPTLEALRGLSDEQVHDTPALIVEAGHSLGKIAQALRDNPELKEAALSFYESCASRSDVPKSIRALCYSDLKNLAMSAVLGEDEDSSDFPEDVRALARQLEGN